MKRREALLLLGVLTLRPRARAQDSPLLSEQDPLAKQHEYLENAARGPEPTHTCVSCVLYQGSADSAQGPCQLFPKHQVKAAGTCKDWAPQM
ncbi:MAG: high-potential iron-sulfur protein [Proteobacteria bacterium]|nr:high-potential iron-sulfur protein [Pseudomonadota bacterium]